MTDLFDTPEKRSNAVLLFQSLQEHQGWQLLVQIVKANIDILREQLEVGIEEETIETIKEVRTKIKIHENIIATPTNMIKGFTEEEDKDPELDPYPQTLKESQETP